MPNWTGCLYRSPHREATGCVGPSSRPSEPNRFANQCGGVRRGRLRTTCAFDNSKALRAPPEEVGDKPEKLCSKYAGLLWRAGWPGPSQLPVFLIPSPNGQSPWAVALRGGIKARDERAPHEHGAGIQTRCVGLPELGGSPSNPKTKRVYAEFGPILGQAGGRRRAE